jgi:hypothetical protein
MPAGALLIILKIREIVSYETAYWNVIAFTDSELADNTTMRPLYALK